MRPLLGKLRPKCTGSACKAPIGVLKTGGKVLENHIPAEIPFAPVRKSTGC